MNIDLSYRDYKRVEEALKYLSEHIGSRPSVKEMSRFSGLSEFHFHRVFTRWAGISPGRFLKYLGKENVKRILEKSGNLLEAAHHSGLSSTSRLHDLIVSTEGITPGELKTGGEGVNIHYGIHPSPFGSCLVALTKRGICHLSFHASDDPDKPEDLMKNWINATFTKDQEGTEDIVKKIFDIKKEQIPERINLYIRGTNFQLKVWEALLRIPPGYMVSYEDIAELIKRPDATRAVSSAIAKNPVSFLIPCHRVIRKMGIIHNYRWGTEKKLAILGWESSGIKDIY